MSPPAVQTNPIVDAAQAFASARRVADTAELRDFLRIPSISTEAAYQPDVARAARWLAGALRTAGLQQVAILPTAGHPVVYADWLHAGPQAPTLLVYGHYDVQPPGDAAEWESDPFGAEIRDNRVYARGASDNKGQLFSHVKAAAALLATAGRLPVNLKFCFDGEEEVGSPNLDPFVRAERERLAADLLVISDGAMLGPGRPSIDYALRGIVALDLRVHGPARALHSGSYGGSVHNPAQALAEIVAALHDEDGRVAIPGFYDDVAPLSEVERRLLAQVPYDEAMWRSETGAPAPWGEGDYTLYERMTARPTCEVNGLWGGYQGEGVRTIIPPEAGAKISLRLVADQEPARVRAQFEAFVRDIAPPTVEIELIGHAGAPAAVTAYDSAAVDAAVTALTAQWGRQPVLGRGGGSLPVVATFQRELGTPFVLMPFGLDDNRHGPNEHYDLERWARGIDTAIHFYVLLGALAPGEVNASKGRVDG